MAVVHHICNRIAVMWKGQIVEEGECDEVVHRPKHQYTQALLRAVPEPNPRAQMSGAVVGV